MEKSKAEKSPWVKKMKKSGPKKKEKAPFCQSKKKNLAESDKGSWFGQTPSQSQHLLKIQSVQIWVFLKLSFDSLTSRFSAAHFYAFNVFVAGFAFAFGIFAHYIMSS